jgi:hypothetical protein
MVYSSKALEPLLEIYFTAMAVYSHWSGMIAL